MHPDLTYAVDPRSPAGRALVPGVAAWPRRVSILGSTGTVGQAALEIVRQHRASFVVDTLAAGTRAAALAAQIAEFAPAAVSVADDATREAVVAASDFPRERIAVGPEALAALAARPVDVVLHAVSGAAGLPATLGAVDAGRRIGLANKESLVLAGALVDARARASGASIVPVDSEHAALFQCLAGAGAGARFERLILTASGGPLRTRADWADATPDEVLAHPVWRMGPRITVDSALLFNKGLEVIEATALFGVPVAAVDVVVHPQAVVHGFVEFVDRSTLAQLSRPDMKLPVQLALAWPGRLPAPIPRLDPGAVTRLDFEPLVRGRFPAFDLALAAAAKGGTAPAIANGADEVAVEAFLERRIRLGDVPAVLADALERVPVRPADSLAAIEAADRDAREAARAWLARHAGSRA